MDGSEKVVMKTSSEGYSFPGELDNYATTE